MDRIILHSDCNCFYASVECLYHPELRDKPVAVGGDEKKRHGRILTKNYIAKKYGILYFEELTAPHPDLLSYVHRQTGIPVASGERIYSRWQFQKHL